MVRHHAEGQSPSEFAVDFLIVSCYTGKHSASAISDRFY
jgi:hypothetical protein